MAENDRPLSAGCQSRVPLTPKGNLHVGLESMLYKRDGIATQGSTPKSLKDSDSAAMDRLLSHILTPLLQYSDGPTRPVLGLHNCGVHVERLVASMTESNRLEVEQRTTADDGRFGSRHTELVGLGRSMKMVDYEVVCENSSTATANTFVCRGKWQYEVSLCTKGQMRLGWCKAGSSGFSMEGVGSTISSFAYDGRQKRKFNLFHWSYGEDEWGDGDVIGCLIDLDGGTVSFTCNGRSLGVAFDSVSTGPSFAYCPAITLDGGERCLVNFGQRPLRYPAEGYRPLVDPLTEECQPLCILFDCFRQLVALDSFQDSESSLVASIINRLRGVLPKIRHIVGHHLLAPTMSLYFRPFIFEYATASVVVPFLVTVDGPVSASNALDRRPRLESFLELAGALMDTEYHFPLLLKYVTQAIFMVLFFSGLKLDLQPQVSYGALLLGIFRNTRCRRTILSDDRILFRKWFVQCVNSPSPDSKELEEILPSVWWEGCAIQDEQHDREAYEEATVNLINQCAVMDKLHVAICKTLLEDGEVDNEAGFYEPPQVIVCRELRIAVRRWGSQENTSGGELLGGMAVSMLTAARMLWDELAVEHPGVSPSSDLHILDSLFFTAKNDLEEYTRLGGVPSHLRKEYRDVLEEEFDECIAAEESVYNDTFECLIEIFNTIFTILNRWLCNDLVSLFEYFRQMKDFSNGLNKYTEVKQQAAIHDMELETAVCLDEYLKCMQTTLEREARGMSCLRQVAYSQDIADCLAWVCRVSSKVILRFLDKGELLSFLPEFYLRVAGDSFFCLRLLVHNVHDFFSREDAQFLLDRMALVLCRLLHNEYIVSPDARDTISQYINMFCALPDGRRAFSCLPVDRLKEFYRDTMQSLSATQRNWPQALVIAERLWLVPSFADHALPRVSANPWFGSAVDLSYEDVFDNGVLDYRCEMSDLECRTVRSCLEDDTLCSALLNGVMNRLNLSFSELVGIMQALNEPSVGDERRMYQVCTFSFNLTILLLRMTEHLALLSPAMWLSESNPTALIMLPRLCQTLGQILKRFTARGGLFEQLPAHRVQILTDVKPAPLLATVTGILLSLTVRCHGELRNRGVAAVTAELGWDIAKLSEVLGVSNGAEATGGDANQSTHESKQASYQGFSLRRVDQLASAECEDVALLVELLTEREATAKEEMESNDQSENLCSICCARPISARFQPCGHLSCKECISYQMMNDPRCFFCKEEVQSFADTTDVKFRESVDMEDEDKPSDATAGDHVDEDSNVWVAECEAPVASHGDGNVADQHDDTVQPAVASGVEEKHGGENDCDNESLLSDTASFEPVTAADIPAGVGNTPPGLGHADEQLLPSESVESACHANRQDETPACTVSDPDATESAPVADLSVDDGHTSESAQSAVTATENIPIESSETCDTRELVAENKAAAIDHSTDEAVAQPIADQEEAVVKADNSKCAPEAVSDEVAVEPVPSKAASGAVTGSAICEVVGNIAVPDIVCDETSNTNSSLEDSEVQQEVVGIDGPFSSGGETEEPDVSLADDSRDDSEQSVAAEQTEKSTAENTPDEATILVSDETHASDDHRQLQEQTPLA